MTDKLALAEQIERVSKIDAIAADLLSIGNDRKAVKKRASAAKRLPVGGAVKHTSNPNVRGVVGYAVTESLCVAVTQPDNLHGAFFFADPTALRAGGTDAK